MPTFSLNSIILQFSHYFFDHANHILDFTLFKIICFIYNMLYVLYITGDKQIKFNRPREFINKI